MNRRQALQTMMGALGLASTARVFGASAFLTGRLPAARQPVLEKANIQLLEAVADTIIPTTADSPGAKAAGIGHFFQVMVSDYYAVEEQKALLRGLPTLRSLCQEKHGADFAELDTEKREALLLDLEADASADYYQMVKQLTVWGYFSSEVGAKQALRFDPIPGKYDGDVKIEPGTKAWANLLS